MGEMIERIGRAIDDAWNSEGKDLPPIELSQDERDYLARAILNAMRVPTDEMIQAGADGTCISEEACIDIWADMIVAAGANP